MQGFVLRVQGGKELESELGTQRVEGGGHAGQGGVEGHLTELAEECLKDPVDDAATDDHVLILSAHALLDLHEDVVEEVLEDAQDLLLRVVVVLERL